MTHHDYFPLLIRTVYHFRQGRGRGEKERYLALAQYLQVALGHAFGYHDHAAQRAGLVELGELVLEHAGFAADPRDRHVGEAELRPVVEKMKVQPSGKSPVPHKPPNW